MVATKYRVALLPRITSGKKRFLPESKPDIAISGLRGMLKPSTIPETDALVPWAVTDAVRGPVNAL